MDKTDRNSQYNYVNIVSRNSRCSTSWEKYDTLAVPPLFQGDYKHIVDNGYDTVVMPCLFLADLRRHVTLLYDSEQKIFWGRRHFGRAIAYAGLGQKKIDKIYYMAYSMFINNIIRHIIL